MTQTTIQFPWYHRIIRSWRESQEKDQKEREQHWKKFDVKLKEYEHIVDVLKGVDVFTGSKAEYEESHGIKTKWIKSNAPVAYAFDREFIYRGELPEASVRNIPKFFELTGFREYAQWGIEDCKAGQKLIGLINSNPFGHYLIKDQRYLVDQGIAAIVDAKPSGDSYFGMPVKKVQK